MTPVIRPNSLYTAVNAPTWGQVLLGSESLGGALVAIENGEENALSLTH